MEIHEDTTDECLSWLKSVVDSLKELLDDPQPGLLSWSQAFAVVRREALLGYTTSARTSWQEMTSGENTIRKATTDSVSIQFASPFFRDRNASWRIADRWLLF